VAKNTITYQYQDSKKKTAHLDSILNTEYLLSLFNDTRSRPVCSVDNPYGYSPNTISIDSTGAQTIDILAGNSIAIYKAMYKHLFGQTDIRRPTRNS
jgi:hypothetical protein